MTDIFNSIAKWFEERSTSPLYGTFIFSVILWNWEFFYILFWQSEEKLAFPRIEYVQKFILDQQTVWQHFLHFLILPILSTFVILWWLPIVSNWAHKKHLSFYYKKRLIMDEARLDYERKEKKTLDSISSLKKEQIVVKKEIQKNTTEDERWDQDYERFKKLNFAYKFQKIIDSYYKMRGFISDTDEINRIIFEIPEDVLAYAHSNEIVTIDQQANKIDMTPKGKYFINKFLEDPNRPNEFPF
jgi:hypothetical protein